MTPPRTTDMQTTGSYLPGSQDQRRDRRDEPEGDAPAPRWWSRLPKPTEIAVALSLLLGSASLLGFHYSPPSTAIASEAHDRAAADTVLARRVDSLGRQVNVLSDRLTFTNYMQCMQFKQTNSGPLPIECTKIIQERLSP